MHDTVTPSVERICPDEVEDSLRLRPGIFDAAVLTRRATDGVMDHVAYIVAADPTAVPRAIEGLDQIVPLIRLPRVVDGSVDEPGLKRVPVCTRPSMAEWETRLRNTPGIADAAVIMRASERERPRLHLADLMPGRHGPGAASKPAWVDERAVALRAAIGEPHSNLPAVAEGPALTTSKDFPRTLGEALYHAARETRAGVTYVADNLAETTESYAGLRDRALRMLTGLRQLNLNPGASAIVDISDGATGLAAFWALILGGMVPVPLMLNAADKGAIERLRAAWGLLGRPPVLAGPTMVATLMPMLRTQGLTELALHDVEALSADIAALPTPAIDPEATALILLTSGSTGTPKGVVHTHRSLLTMVAAVTQTEAFGPDDTSLNWMPLDHVGGMVFFSILPIATAASQVHIRPEPVLQQPLVWLDLADRHRASIGWAPNFAYSLIADAVGQAQDRHWDLSAMRFMINAGEAAANAVITAFTERLSRHGLRAGAIRPCFGMSETCSAITVGTWRPTALRLPFADLGAPVPSATARIVDGHGVPLREGEIGQIELAGPQVFKGYFARPDVTAEAFRDGWFRTGDLGYLAGGRLFVTGREKDMIIVNGANYYSHEIETAISAIPGIERTCSAATAVRIPDSTTDQIAVFFHAPSHRGARTTVEMIREIRRRMVATLGVAPDFVVPIDPGLVPRTANGKIRRSGLKEQFEAGAFDAELRRIERLEGGSATVPDWFYEKVWVRQASSAESVQADATWLLFDDASDLAASLRADGSWIVVRPGSDFGSIGPLCWHIDPANPMHFRRLFAEIAPPSRIVYLWGPEVAPLLFLAQALERIGTDQHPTTIIVASDAGAMPGLLAALAADLPGVTFRLIETSGAGQAEMRAECLRSSVEPEISYRDGQRFAARFAPVDARGAAVALPREGVGLVAGGLGGIGRLLCRHLIVQHGLRLQLVGRTAEVELDAERAAVLAALRSLGTVAYAAADVADEAAMRGVADVAHARWGRPADLVVHLAGVGRVVPLAETRPAEIASVMRAKVDGTRVLHGLLAEHPEARFVVVGSVAGALGGPAMAAYAASTSAQAAVALDLAARDDRVRYIALSSWRDTGMSRGTTTPEQLRAAGLYAIDTAAGLASFEAGLRLPARHLLAGLDGDHRRHSHRVLGPAETVEAPVAYVVGAASDSVTMEDRFGTPFEMSVVAVEALPRSADGRLDIQRLVQGAAKGNAAPPRDHTERRLALIWQTVVQVSEPGIHDDFFACGGNSLRAVQVTARIREAFRIDLPVSALMTSPTIAGLAEKLRTLEPKPGFAEAIARRLHDIEQTSPGKFAFLNVGPLS